MVTNKLYKFIKIQLLIKLFVEVLTTTAVFFGTTVSPDLLWQTVSNCRYVKVGKIRHLGSATCLVLS